MGYLNKREQIYKLDRIGRMDRRITIIEKDLSIGDSNEDYVDAWVEFDTVWARKEDLRGKEVVTADKVQFMYLTVWSIRKLEGLKADMRIVYKGQVYEIVQISEGEGRERWIDITTNILENEYWS
jgi:SPP1 family predicted phage head-tail adaptor